MKKYNFLNFTKKTIEQLYEKSSLLRKALEGSTSTSHFFLDSKNSNVVITVTSGTVVLKRIQGDIDSIPHNVVFEHLKLKESYTIMNDGSYSSLNHNLLYDKVMNKLGQFYRPTKTTETLTKIKGEWYQHGEYINNHKFSDKMGVSRRTTQTWRSKGLIPYSKFRGRVYYRVSDINNMLDANSNRPVMDLV